MGKTTRTNPEHLRESKDHYVHDLARRLYNAMLLLGYERVKNEKRAEAYEEAYQAYSQAWDAWDAKGQQEGFEPAPPAWQPRYSLVPFDGRSFETYREENRAAFARDYDKGTRDGQQYHWDGLDFKSPSTRRVKDRHALRALLKDPETWYTDDRLVFHANGTPFRDYYR